jgi:hypothetical protein
MKKIIYLLLLVVGNSIAANAQSANINGTVLDTANVKSIPFASVSLIRKADSILVKHIRTNQQGKFSFSQIPLNQYFILVAHNSFVDYIENVNVSVDKSNLDMGNISMLQRSKMLREVLIRNAANIKFKGDTLEYLADSFKVRDGAMVEDLLKALPGIQVNKNGEITAMGEKVEKVLVDGEEFFGDDPTVATQNLQSKIVEKVQVFDQKSDQAKFTGFDDGQEQKTINLKLKKDMNRGEFGKLEASGGWEDRWTNKAMANSFKNKRQLSAYGLMSSNGITGLGWEERNQFGSSNQNMTMDDDNGFMFTTESGTMEDGGNGNWGTPEGITKAWNTGVHYANKWNEGAEHLNGNYSFGRIQRNKRETSLTENLFPNRNYITKDTSSSFTNRNTHRLNINYETMVDSSLSIIYRMTGRLSILESETNRLTFNSSMDDAPINISNNKNTSESTSLRISNQITTNKKLKKLGRTISLMAKHELVTSDLDGKLEGLNQFYNVPITINNTIDQKKLNNSKENYITASATYTEPLSKKILLKASYEIATEANNSSKLTREKENVTSEEYLIQIDSLSSDFDSRVFNHTGGLEFKWNEKKYSVTLGSRVRYSKFDQRDIIRSIDYNYTRINLFPNLRLNYKFDQSKRLTFAYTGFTRQPSIQQLQPVQDNTSPLNINVGNPNLRLSFTQNFNLNYFNFKLISNRSLYSNFTFSNTFNNMVSDRIIDELGRTISRTVNVQGGYNVNYWGGINSRVKKSILEAGANLNFTFNHMPNIINGIKGFTDNLEIGITPTLRYPKEDKYIMELSLATQFNRTSNTLQIARNIQYFSFNPSYNATVYLPKNFEINVDLNYQYTPPVAPYTTNFTRFIANAYASKKMLKNSNLELRASIFDAFNQNKGYERTTTNNTNSERNFLTLSRYWLVGLIWNFTNGPMASAQPQGGPNGQRMRGGSRPRMMRRPH